MPYSRLVHRYEDVAASRNTIATPDKENGVYVAGLNLPLSENDEDYAAMLVANYIFGGSGLNSRLMLRVRQKEGLSYGIASQLSADPVDRAGRFDIHATAAPQNLARVEAAINEELQAALVQGFSEDELARAKSGLAQLRLQGRTQDANLASGWTRNLLLQRSFAWSQALDEKIAALTAAQVSSAFARYVQPAKLSAVIAADPAKVLKPP
jgi:zinc protease